MTLLSSSSTHMDHTLEDDSVQRDPDESSCQKSPACTAVNSGYNQNNGFECNICLDQVKDPVVTLCGHLYCWHCIYRWLESQRASPCDMEEPQQCPVCKSEISQTRLIPLYGRGQATRNTKNKGHQLGIAVPPRPLAPILPPEAGRSVPRVSTSNLSSGLGLNSGGYHFHLQPHTTHLGHSTAPAMLDDLTMMSLVDLIVGILGETVQSRASGSSVTGSYAPPNEDYPGGSIPGVRRRVMQVNKSLSKICFFLLCCCILCLLLF
ncbi:hypothetical protein SAY87_027243 [Trapa incisa]|uniref:E3 ubiquitin-protein ligase RMA n=2 Tax=Trapa TaxID=22665 RepID=A0AAN7RBQ4_TRANT|nr:hypothetical protein SAY87_027243 [Trapa incisa]KAK4799339.1 hypothetical protein SAY86_024704 [Trapa natans]